MELGCNVITEKPMTIDAPAAARSSQASSGRGRASGVHLQLSMRPAQYQGLRAAPLRRHRNCHERALRVDARTPATVPLLTSAAGTGIKKNAGGLLRAASRPTISTWSTSGSKPGPSACSRARRSRSSTAARMPRRGCVTKFYSRAQKRGGQGGPLRAAHGGDSPAEGHVSRRRARG